jgi:hypothetical protein
MKTVPLGATDAIASGTDAQWSGTKMSPDLKPRVSCVTSFWSRAREREKERARERERERASERKSAREREREREREIERERAREQAREREIDRERERRPRGHVTFGAKWHLAETT